MEIKDQLLMLSSSCKLLWAPSDHAAYQDHRDHQVCKDFRDFEESQEKQVRRARQDLKVKEDSPGLQAKMVTLVRMAGPDHKAHRALWAREDFLVCRDSQASKATGVFQALTAPRVSRVLKVKRDQWEHQEDKDHQDLSAQLDHEESEEETGLRDHRECEDLTASLDHQDQRVLWGVQARQGYQERQA